MLQSALRQLSRSVPLGPAVALTVAGLVVSWATLSLAGFWQTHQWPAAAVPFGVNRVLVVHLICVLPLALWCGRWPPLILGTGLKLVGACILVGLGLAVTSLLVSPDVRQEVQGASSGELHVWRLGWVWLLLLPWSTAATMVYATTAPAPANRSGDQSSRLVWVDGVIAGLFALLAVMHVWQVIERQSALVVDAMVNQQSLRALQISEQLVELGSSTIGGQPAREMVVGLSEQVELIQRRLRVPLSGNVTVQQRLDRVRDLYSLGQFDEAQPLLQDLDDDPRARLWLGLISEARHQYAQAAREYARTIELLGQISSPDAEQLRLLRIAFERRVNNLRRIGENRQAESELLSGLARWPQVQDALLMQLGFHYQLAGRIAEAIDYFQQAAAVNPRLKPQADATLELLQLQAEGCLLRPTRGVTR